MCIRDRLSSAEAELYAMVAASAETLALAAYARDLGLILECELYCDSSAALGIAQRAGIGKVRHLRKKGLWVQETRVSGRNKYMKLLGGKKLADLMTKHVDSATQQRLLVITNIEERKGRAESAPQMEKESEQVYCVESAEEVENIMIDSDNIIKPTPETAERQEPMEYQAWRQCTRGTSAGARICGLRSTTGRQSGGSERVGGSRRARGGADQRKVVRRPRMCKN